MKRITPEEVVEAYKSTGLKPVRGTFCWGSRACGLGTVCISRGKMPTSPLMVSRSLGIEMEYLLGFVNGFDGIHKASIGIDESNETLSLGFADGKLAAAAVFKDSPRNPPFTSRASCFSPTP